MDGHFYSTGLYSWNHHPMIPMKPMGEATLRKCGRLVNSVIFLGANPVLFLCNVFLRCYIIDNYRNICFFHPTWNYFWNFFITWSYFGVGSPTEVMCAWTPMTSWPGFYCILQPDCRFCCSIFHMFLIVSRRCS